MQSTSELPQSFFSMFRMAASLELQSGTFLYDLWLTARDIHIANSNSKRVVSQARHDIRYMPSLTTTSFSSQLPPYHHTPTTR